MKQRKSRWIVAACIAAVVLAGYYPVRKAIERRMSERELASRMPTFTGDSNELSRTVTLPAFDSPIEPGKNNIWCSSFQLAWNEMKDSVIKGPIEVAGAEDTAQRLNTAKQNKSDLSPESYYVAAGVASPEFLDKLRFDMAERFPSVEPPVFDPNDVLVGYAYLETYLKFKAPYRQYEKPMLFTDSSGGSTPVSSFGVWDGYLSKYKPLCRQIDVLYCRIDELQDPQGGLQFQLAEFALDLCRHTQPYQIVVAMIEPQDSLEATYIDLQQKIAAFQNDSGRDTLLAQFMPADTLAVPDIYWRITHHFAELEGKKFANTGDQIWPITTAMQVIDFRLDRSGAIVKSEAKFGVSAEPKEFRLDRPFLVYLKKRDAAQPFFVMWVDNAELLTPFTQ